MFLEAIRSGKVSNLQGICLGDLRYTLPTHREVLGEILRGGVCPKLESLDLSYCTGLGDEGLLCILKVWRNCEVLGSSTLT